MTASMKKIAGLLLLGMWLVTGSGCSGEQDGNAAAPSPSTRSIPTAATDEPAKGGGTASTPSVENTPSVSSSSSAALTPEQYIKNLDPGVKVEDNPVKFPVQVPADWQVKQGEYPIGLYWQLMNRYAQDAGFDLAPLKGTSVEAWRYLLTDGLPGEGPQMEFTYPSNLLLLVQKDQVVGAWMEFNSHTIAGPSVHKHSLDSIAGYELDEWVEHEGLLADAGENGDLSKMLPSELITAYYAAVQSGDETRAEACLTPSALMQSLSVNLGPNRLYNPGFSPENTLHGGIAAVKVLSFQYLDPEQNSFVAPEAGQEAALIGDRSELMMEVKLDLTVSPDAKATSSGKQPRFAAMKKLATGWKIAGLGTGP